MRRDGIPPAQIPGPPAQDDGADAVVAAGGLHNYQLKLHAEYGPVVRFPLPGADLAVSVADPVLLEATAKIDKRPEKLFEFLAPLQESGNLQTLPADEHGPWRRVMLSVLAGRPSHEAHFARFAAMTSELADRWAGRDGAVALQKDLSELSLRMICRYALGSGLDSEGSAGRVVSAFENVLTEYLARLYQVDAPGTENERRTRADESLAYLRATVDRVLTAHRETARAGHGDTERAGRDDIERTEPGGTAQTGHSDTGPAGHSHTGPAGHSHTEPAGHSHTGPAGRGGGGRSDMIAALVEAGESPARIRDTVLMTMLAAHHTTGVAISWTLYLLARHPDAAERVAAELDRVLGDRAEPGYADLKVLTYLDSVLREAMRLFPPGPYGAREATEDFMLGDYAISAGTTIFYPFWAVHMNPEHWPDPEVFDPGRFTPEASAKRHRFAYIPFGLGPRSCEGAALAMVEAQLVLAVMLKRFRFRLTPGQTVTPIERFVLWAAEDIHMNITPREASGV